MRPRNGALGSTLAAAMSLLAVSARAQEPAGSPADDAMQGGVTEERVLADEQARLHYRAARGLYDAGRFRDAAEAFEEAYRLSRRPELLFNAYIARRDANDLEEAVRNLGAYLEHVGDAPDRVNLQARLRSMSEALEERRAREAEARARASAEQAPAASGSGDEAWPWVIAAIGGAALVSGAVTGGVALAQADALVRDCGGVECASGVDLAGRRSSVEALGMATDVLLFGGGAIALTGLVLGLALSSSGARERSADVAGGCGPSGCALTLRTRF